MLSLNKHSPGTWRILLDTAKFSLYTQILDTFFVWNLCQFLGEKPISINQQYN